MHHTQTYIQLDFNSVICLAVQLVETGLKRVEELVIVHHYARMSDYDLHDCMPHSIYSIVYLLHRHKE